MRDVATIRSDMLSYRRFPVKKIQNRENVTRDGTQRALTFLLSVKSVESRKRLPAMRLLLILACTEFDIRKSQ